MANWAKGLAAGLETGYKFGEMYQKGAERRALQEAATEQAQQQYTPEMGTELERIAGLTTQNAQGETVPQYQLTTQPGSVNYGLSQYNPETGGYDAVRTGAGAAAQPYQIAPQQFSMYGKTYNEQLTPERERGLRMERMAGVVAESDPIKAEQLRAMSAEQDFQAKYRPLQLESMGLKLEGERADAADRKRMTDFQAWVQEDPTRAQNFQAVASKARELGMSMDQQFKVASNLTGIDEAEFKASQSRIRKMTQGQGLDGLLKLHKDSSDLDPGSHFEKTIGKDGRITLNRVDSATGKVIQPNVFSGKEDEVVGYLHKAAMDPAAIVDYTMNLRKNNAAIEASEASAAAHRAYAGKLGAAADDAKGLEKKIKDFKTVFGRDPTEDEKKVIFGLAPKPRDVSDTAVIELAKTMDGKPTGRLVDGKPERYTTATAMTAARGILSQQEGAGAPSMPSWDARPQGAPSVVRTSPAAQTAPQPPVRGLSEPQNREEFDLAGRARQLGLYPVGRGNSVFGAGELLFEDNTGKRVWASQIK